MSYLGKKGYSIYKKDLTNKEQIYIRNELTVKPYLPKSPAQPEPFPIYRESPQKFYIPRYFGIDNFGDFCENKLSLGDDIDLNFEGELREYQINIVNKYLNFVKDSGGGLLDVDPGKGKTVMALYIISKLKKKTLVIVHKSFLLNQWLERIQQFLPNARVGKIQGQTIDIDDKDIVIGMLQSLSQKEYPDNLFDSFGLSIYDETHHLGAEVFSRCMMKSITNYTLGLSGTMQRKDGLTKVFKMFLGDIVHKEKSNTKEHNVIVKGIYYKHDDPEFNEIKYDYKGNPLYSTMISKLCNFNHRSEFIIKVLQNELQKNPDQQIMILAHNKSLITYLFKAIEHRNIASVGYYIGGMKEADLKESENKKIIIATYAMASEGLDIKTLTTLLMASPKTDVCQSVGRILRTKHTQPLVIDIIDSHEIFTRQWQKRRQYYMKQKYNIISTKNNEYMDDKWETEFDPSKAKESTNKIKKKEEPLKGVCLIKI
jgi:superfamily II DNA or RNA helicase